MDEGHAPHLRFVRAVRGALVAEAAHDLRRYRDIGWKQVREAWSRPQRNGRPTPWDGLLGAAAARSGSASDLHFEAPSPSEVPDLGIPSLRIHIDADHFYIDLPPGHSTPAQERVGAFTWRYAGQAVYSLRSSGRQPGAWSQQRIASPTVDSARPAGARMKVGRTRRTDNAGRIWLLEAIDDADAADRVRAYDAARGGAEGLREHDPTESRGIGRVNHVLEVDDAQVFGRPVGYTATYCYNGAISYGTDYDNFIADHSYDHLSKSGCHYNDRSEKVLLMHTGPGRCSASKMDKNNALTAAHCVLDAEDGYSELPAWKMTVCTYANDGYVGGMRVRAAPAVSDVECAGVGSVVNNGDYRDTFDQPDDWALLSLTTNITKTESFYLSTRGTSLASWTAATRGFPGGQPGGSSPCSWNSITDATAPFSSVPILMGGKVSGLGNASCQTGFQYVAEGTVAGVNSDTINFYMSSAAGMSGGPAYYCSTGDCGDGAAQTSLQSVWTGFSLNGPRSRDFRANVIASM